MNRLRMVVRLGVLTLIAGCGAPTPGSDEEAECSGFGHRHDDGTCHCERGFVSPPGEPTACVPAPGTGGGAGGGGAGGADGGGGEGAPRPTTVTVVLVQSAAEYSTAQGGDQVWRFGGISSPFIVNLENYSRYGGPTTAGRYTLRPEDSSYQSCAFCLMLRRGSERYMPVFVPGKTVTYTSLGTRPNERFSGAIDHQIELRQVTIDPRTFSTSDVANGKRLVLNGFSFSAVIEPPECGGNGHLHGNVCHCDPGFRLDPTNPRNCIR